MTVTVLNRDAVLLPRCTGAQPETLCTCGGSYLTLFMGRLVHVAVCRNCVGKGRCPTPDLHTACPAPEPVVCPHGACRRDATVDVVCAHSLAGCCGCCWIGVPDGA